MKIALIHPGHALSTAWIFDGYESAFEDLGIEVETVRLDNLISTASEFITYKASLFSGEQGASIEQWAFHMAQQLAIPRIMECIRSGCEVMLNICGKLWTAQNLGLLNMIPIAKTVFLTESPYEDDTQRHILAMHNSGFVNDRNSVETLGEVRPVTYMPHAFDPDVFRYIEIERKHKYDYSFIGTPFGNRRRIIADLKSTPMDGYIFDQVQQDGPDGKPQVCFVPQENAARIYNQTKVNLNIHREEKYFGREDTIDTGSAYSLGPRAFEIAGCRAFQLCDNTRPELVDIFGETVATYDQPECVAEAIAYWADDARAGLRRDMATASWEIAQGHTYHHRALRLVEQLAQWYNRPDWLEGLPHV